MSVAQLGSPCPEEGVLKEKQGQRAVNEAFDELRVEVRWRAAPVDLQPRTDGRGKRGQGDFVVLSTAPSLR